MLTILPENADQSSLDRYVKNDAPLTVLYFTATWCGPCKAIAPTVQEYADKYPSINFYKIDVDIFEELTMYAGVNCMPTFQIYKSGEIVDTLEGADAQTLLKMIKDNLLI
jgi:thiol-disulfide isomerase/thioredoxin